jgi:hypothetical protein
MKGGIVAGNSTPFVQKRTLKNKSHSNRFFGTYQNKILAVGQRKLKYNIAITPTDPYPFVLAQSRKEKTK